MRMPNLTVPHRTVVLAVVLSILAITFSTLTSSMTVSPALASPPANHCAMPCDVCGADGTTCYRRWWADLDTFTIKAYPVQINRNSVGKLNYTQCQLIPGTDTPNQWCGGVKPEPITLREWCRRLMALPVPPRIRPSDEGDLYVLFSSGGVCP